MHENPILTQAARYQNQMIELMRALIAIPGESTAEREVVSRIRAEMEAAGFDEVRIDPMGNVLGRIGSGRTVIAMDAHVDTVGVGSPGEWRHDPFAGKFEDGVIYGRGASDQRASVVSMIAAARIIRDLGLEGDYTLWIVGSVQEEDCDGLCWQYITREGGLRPDCVVITEPTNLNVYRGHRGRMEIGVRTLGKSCHGSAPERGRNAVFMVARIALEIERLNERLRHDPFLGKGTVTVSYIDCETPSRCAVPGKAFIHLDRRLTAGETKATALREVREAIQRAKIPRSEVQVEVLRYATPSYTGLVYPTEKYYPTWLLAEDHPLCAAAVQTSRAVFGRKPKIGKWTFSTNGVATMGLLGIPSVGFGPANEIHAHTVDDQVPVEHLVKAAAWYAAFPGHWVRAAQAPTPHTRRPAPRTRRPAPRTRRD